LRFWRAFLSLQEKKGLSSTDLSASSQHVVWGTSVDVNHSMRRLKRFFVDYIDMESGEKLYPRLIEEIVQADVYNLNVDCLHLHEYDSALYAELVRYPQELIPLMDLVVHELIDATYPDMERTQRTQVRTFNLREKVNMRDLNPDDIDKLVCVKGMVIRCSSILPDLRSAFFECRSCNSNQEVMIERGKVQHPTICQMCNERNTMEMIHNRSHFADKQLIKLQETPDSIPEGETPHTVSVFSFDDLVDVAKPGDRVVLTGIFKARPVRVNSRKRTVRSVYHTYIDVIHFQKSEKGRLGAEDSTADKSSEFYTNFEESNVLASATEAKIEELRALSRDENIYERLTKSIAPNVFQMDDIKKGILCLLFGGANKNIGADGGKFRGELNVLLCGDPGTSKSQLLQYVHKLAPRGIYTSGKGSSAVGLTAYITKDPETREMILESGALVLSDRGVCCIDEFDKMSDATRSILHEVMEQQTVSIAKAGIVCTLNARTSIVASANPVGSRYDPKKTVVENINITPTLLSRFDLIYLVLDNPNEASDRRLAKHLVSLYYAPEDREAKEDEEGVIPTSVLTNYISYAKSHIQPKITDDSVDELVNGYVEMRNMGQNAHRKVVTATPRQLESLIRLSEALARMRFSEFVEVSDVQEARRLMAVATQSVSFYCMHVYIDAYVFLLSQYFVFFLFFYFFLIFLLFFYFCGFVVVPVFPHLSLHMLFHSSLF